MNVNEITAKAERGEGLTVEEIKVYTANVKPEKHTYGKYGTLKKRYLEDKGVDWTIADLPTYLHNVDRQADELYEIMYAKLSNDKRFKHTGDYMDNLRRQTEMQHIIEEEILNEIVYTA